MTLVWLASYPRSGNTLIRAVLRQRFGLTSYSLYNDVRDISARRSVAEVVGHVPHDGGQGALIEQALASSSLFLVKTHDPPIDDNPAIYIVRNPMSAVVSYFHYLRDFANEEANISDVILGRVSFGLWSSHVKGWDPLRRPKTLLLRFEEMRQNIDEQAHKISEFLKKPQISQATPEFGQLRALDNQFFRSGDDGANIAELGEAERELCALVNYPEQELFGYPAPIGEPFRAAQILADAFRNSAVDFAKRLGESNERLEAVQAQSAANAAWAQRTEVSLQRKRSELEAAQGLAIANAQWARRTEDALGKALGQLESLRQAYSDNEQLLLEEAAAAGALRDALEVGKRAEAELRASLLNSQAQAIDASLRLSEVEAEASLVKSELARTVRQKDGLQFEKDVLLELVATTCDLMEERSRLVSERLLRWELWGRKRVRRSGTELRHIASKLRRRIGGCA